MRSIRFSSFLPAPILHAARALRSSDDRSDLSYEYARRRRGEPALPLGPIRRVTVLCYGNICRSPFAGLDLARLNPGLEVRSAGLFAREGKPPEQGALRVAKEFGIDLSGHGAHLLDSDDVEWSDLLLGMQGRHVDMIVQRWPKSNAKTLLLGDFQGHPPYWIDDPWGHPDAFFREVYQQIVDANERLTRRLRTTSSA